METNRVILVPMKEAANELGISLGYLYECQKAGKVTKVKVGSKSFLREQDIAALRASRSNGSAV